MQGAGSTADEDSDIRVIEHEHLVAQHREPVEIVGTLMVRDRRDRRLESRDVRLERNGHFVAEAALHSRADDAQEPRGRRRDAKRDRRRDDEPAFALQDAFAKQLEPERKQCVWQHRELRESERCDDQLGFVTIADCTTRIDDRAGGRSRRAS